MKKCTYTAKYWLWSATGMTVLQLMDCVSFPVARSGALVIDNHMSSQKVPDNKTGIGNHFSNMDCRLLESIFHFLECSVEVFLTFRLPLHAHRRALEPLNWEKLQTLLLARQKDIIKKKKKVIIRETYENNFIGFFFP